MYITEEVLLANGFDKRGASYPNHRYELWLDKMDCMIVINESQILPSAKFTVLDLIKLIDAECKDESNYQKYEERR